MKKFVQVQAINAATINVSGRQRMLSQRITVFCFQLVTAKTAVERQNIRIVIADLVSLMSRSHQGLLYGDAQLDLPGNPSPEILELHFKAPHQLDQQIQRFVWHIQHLIDCADADLSDENVHLKAITDAASHQLLDSLDLVVRQYERESNAEQFQIEVRQRELYQKSLESANTARVQAEELQLALQALQKTQAQLMQSEKLSGLGQLVAGITHEINNPVGFIYGNLSFLSEYAQTLIDIIKLYQENYPQNNPEIQTYLEKVDLNFIQDDLFGLLKSIENGTQRIQKIVDSLKNFSRLGEVGKKEVNLHKEIDNVLFVMQQRFGRTAERSPIAIHKSYCADLPLVRGYPANLNQCFMHLLINAVEAIDTRSQAQSAAGLILDHSLSQISIQTFQPHANQVKICISDTGIGICSSIKEKIFDPFFTTKPIGSATGMGLAICHQIVVEQHGGKLSFHSALGQGTEWQIELPIDTETQGC